MIRFILACFGYIKVPKEEITLSMKIEDDYKILVKIKPDFIITYEAAQALTGLLRTGRLIRPYRDSINKEVDPYLQTR